MSITLALTGKSSTLTANYFPPIQLHEDYECSLVDFHSYNSIPNIDFDNNLFHIGNKTIEVPIGSYELEDIVDYIKSEYENEDNTKTIDIIANNNTLQLEIFSSHDIIDFNNERSICTLFGFNGGVLRPGVKHFSHYPVNILRVSAIQVQCNITTGAYMNNAPVHTLHEFGINVSPGYKMDEIPSNLIYLPVNAKEISSLKVWIVDQNQRLINFRGEEITLRLHLRPISK